MRFQFPLLLLLALLLAGCGSEEPRSGLGGEVPDRPIGRDLRKVTLLLNWYPEHQHGGYYTALINGYYADEGLDVEILPGGPQVPVLQRVGSGQVDFGVTNADQLIYGRAAGARLVSTLAPLQDSPRCLLFHAEAGIRDFDDIRNMTLAMNDNDAFAAHLRARYPLDGVTIVRYTGNLAQFLSDRNFGQQAYSISEPVIARARGARTSVLMLHEAGYNPYTSTLFTLERRLEEDGGLVRRMTRASARGWRVYMNDPAKTNAYLREINPEMDREVLREGWELMKPLVLPEGMDPGELGRMTLERWSELLDSMEETGQVEVGRVRAADCFINLSDGE